jgi:hypothetical protein
MSAMQFRVVFSVTASAMMRIALLKRVDMDCSNSAAIAAADCGSDAPVTLSLTLALIRLTLTNHGPMANAGLAADDIFKGKLGVARLKRTSSPHARFMHGASIVTVFPRGLAASWR